MAFDFGAGLSAMGGAVSKTAGDYLLENQKSIYEQEKLKLADQLAQARDKENQKFTAGESDKDRAFKGEEGEKTRTSEEKRTGISAGATIGAASIAAEASRQGHEITARSSENVARIYVEGRDKAAQTAADAKRDVAKIVADARKTTQDLIIPSGDALETLANSYNATGSLPNTGYGGTAGKTAVLNRAAQLRKEQGISDETWMDKSVMAKTATTVLPQLQKQYSAVEAFSATAAKNGEIVKELLDKGVGPSGLPIVDAWIQSGRRQTGDDDVAKFGAALYAYMTENAKVMSGAMGNAPLSDQSVKNMDKVMNGNMNRDQLLGVMAVMEDERNNRMLGFQEQIQKLRGQATGKGDQGILKPGGASTPANPGADPKLTPRPLPVNNGKIDPGAMIDGQTYITPSGPGVWDSNTNRLMPPGVR